MFELLMLLILPSEINPQEVGIKYLLKDRFTSYETCEDYVKKIPTLRRAKLLMVYFIK